MIQPESIFQPLVQIQSFQTVSDGNNYCGVVYRSNVSKKGNQTMNMECRRERFPMDEVILGLFIWRWEEVKQCFKGRPLSFYWVI